MEKIKMTIRIKVTGSIPIDEVYDLDEEDFYGSVDELTNGDLLALVEDDLCEDVNNNINLSSISISIE